MSRANVISLIGSAAVLACAAGAGAQTFHRAIGFTSVDGAYCVEPCSATTGGGFVTAGMTTLNPAGLRDVYVVRTDAVGNDIWSRVIRSTNNVADIGFSVRQALDGGFIVAAETTAMGSTFGIGLVRLNAAGNMLWSRVYAGTAFQDFPSGAKVRELPNGNFTVVGRLTTPNIMSGRMITVGPGGNVVWGNTYTNVGAAANISFTDLRTVVTASGAVSGYYVSGWIQDLSATQRSALIVRMNAAGAPVAAWSYSVPGRSITADGLTISGNNIVFSGRMSSSPTAAASSSVIIGVNQATGIVSWARNEADFRTGFAALDSDSAGGVVVAGTVPSSGGIGHLRFTGVGGAFLFGRTHAARGEGHDVAWIPNAPGGYVLTGFEAMAPVNGLQDVALVRTNAAGNVTCLMSPKAGPTPLTVERSIRNLVPTSNVSNITWGVSVETPDSGNIVKCLSSTSEEGPTPCAADWNFDEVVNSGDFFDFLQAFFAGDADFNASGETNSQDMFDFLNEFFRGC